MRVRTVRRSVDYDERESLEHTCGKVLGSGSRGVLRTDGCGCGESTPSHWGGAKQLHETETDGSVLGGRMGSTIQL